ncbi:hypothetical protein Sru01_21440 [Sphaerisporangium rufum]|uniref:Nucleoside diphosphate kinase-like domain-containing protein n=1 Tax=Sphaerisporangium rufum TaxID=1381558 RepID=A0A919R023_9ACTN|nr:nucleoside-diphosphate kinase [Sphaerisporangium rufum]GII77162.1 hypothetical protein Sru01_21440 [Sphaerisporangium rufum]
MSATSPPGVPEHLSGLPAKRALYAADTYFREVLEDLRAACAADGGSVRRFCHDHTLLLFKPDAAVARKMRPGLELVAARGFSVVAATPVTMNRHSIRALWQYGYPAASRDRRDAADLYMTAGDCLLVLLARPGHARPASVLLSQEKGPARPEDCRPGQLRHELGGTGYQLNLLHAPDEPADLLRELGVLCDAPARALLYRQARARQDAAAPAHRLAERLEAAAPRAELRAGPVLRALHEAVAAALARRPRDVPAGLPPLLAAVRSGRSRDWRGLLGLLDAGRIEITRWQRIVVATALLDPFEPGRQSLLPDASARPPQAPDATGGPGTLHGTDNMDRTGGTTATDVPEGIGDTGTAARHRAARDGAGR